VRRVGGGAQNERSPAIAPLAILCIALPALSACGSCDGGTLVQGSSRLEASPAALDFGRVFIGSQGQLQIRLTAAGQLPIKFAARFEGDAAGYALAPASGILAAQQSLAVTVVFRSSTAGLASAKVVFDSDATENATVAVSLFANALEAPDCEDGNGCTVDTFDPIAGRCAHRAERLACDDFNACTSNDTCVDAVCLGESFSCDDGDPCTDDFCDPRNGCIHELTRSCDDGNPCTSDRCDLNRGCLNENLDDGTPCDDLELCTTADICLQGFCLGVNVPDGFRCDDRDPCSLNDQCLEGTCRDPTYDPPAFGEIKFSRRVGDLAPGAGSNPIIDREGTTFVGTSTGVAAVDQCGTIVWYAALPTPTWSAAAAIPGLIVVPIGDHLFDLDSATGELRQDLWLGDLFGSSTSSTATVTTAIVDLAVRGSGALVVSLERTVESGDSIVHEGLLAEVDRSHSVATVFRSLGRLVALRLAIDRDESVVAVLADRRSIVQRLVRFGIDGLAMGTWSTTATAARSTEIALGADGDVIWSEGLIAVSMHGDLAHLLPPDRRAPRAPFVSGSPIVHKDGLLLFAYPTIAQLPPGLGFLPAAGYELMALSPVRTSTLPRLRWTARLSASAEASSPAADAEGNVFVFTRDGAISAFSSEGMPVFRTELPIDAAGADRVSMAISPQRVVVVALDRTVIGVQSTAGLATSPWPRHRRDNLSTGHR
jgi:outer membrane protein assembly factor BamB